MSNKEKFCQCCGMPLSDDVLGTNADGSKNDDYCIYCLKDGKFKYDSLEELINACVPILVKQGFSEEAAIKHMNEIAPKLKHWNK